MLKIGDTLVSLDVVEKYFCCDLDACKGACCIEGDAGAPLSEVEDHKLKELAPKIKPFLSEKGLEVMEREGQSYIDQEGDRVTQLIENASCIYTCFEKGGLCLCALEKARREQGVAELFKPISCSLYPVRVKEYDGFTAVNFHKWKICKSAEVAGRKKGIRAYEFLKEPLTRRFGEEWYEELREAAEEWNRQQEEKSINNL